MTHDDLTAKSVIAGLLEQFAWDGGLYSTWALSALEDAFAYLGLPDPVCREEEFWAVVTPIREALLRRKGRPDGAA